MFARQVSEAAAASTRADVLLVSNDEQAARVAALSRELGTRHRAAIGLTEENDAVAVIVSEESGLISIALDGTIERGLGPADLRSRLKDLVVQRRTTATPARVRA